MKKEYIRPEAEIMKFIEDEEIMTLANEITPSLGVVDDPFNILN